MPRFQITAMSVAAIVCCSWLNLTFAQETKESKMLESMVGSWEGDCKTWLRPGVLEDESSVQGEIKAIAGTKIVRHTYQGSMKDDPRHGEETLAYNPTEGKFEVSWFDTFHMNYAVLSSTGEADQDGQGFKVLAKYRAAPDQDYWKWRTGVSVD